MMAGVGVEMAALLQAAEMMRRALEDEEPSDTVKSSKYARETGSYSCKFSLVHLFVMMSCFADCKTEALEESSLGDSDDGEYNCALKAKKRSHKNKEIHNLLEKNRY